MKMIVLFLLTVSMGLISCSDSFQYDVFVKNATTVDIEVSFKSMKEVDGPIEKIIVVKPNELIRIISTENIAWTKRQMMATPEQCHQVAEYVTAKKGSIESNVQWCDDSIEFSEVDFGQGMFTITYSESNFQ